MAFTDNKITFSTGTDTMLCEVGTPGSLVLSPEQISLAAHPTAQKASVKQVINCLTGEEAAILTGTLSMTSDLAAEGPASDLLSNLKGSLSVSARKGRIYRSNLLTDILYFLSVRNLLSIWKMDIARKGFAYNSLDIKAEVKGNTLFVREGILDSNTLTIAWQGSVNLDTNEIAFTMLATPLQVYDRLLMSIPVVGVVFGSTLVGMPIKVTGTIADHKLGIASPLEIGKGLQGIAKNILKLPVKIIQPVLPQGKEENVN
jgi:hypothetical protein